MSQIYLTSDEIDKLARIGAQYGFGSEPLRQDLFAFIHAGFFIGLAEHAVPREQVHSDLLAMNKVERLAVDGSVPLVLWFRETILRLETQDAADHRVFKTALEKVEAQVTNRTAEANMLAGLPVDLQHLYAIIAQTALHDSVLISRYRWADRYAPRRTMKTRRDLFEKLQDRFERRHFWEVVGFAESIARHSDVESSVRRQLQQWVDNLRLTENLDPHMIQEARQRDYEAERSRRLFQLEIEPDQEDPTRLFLISSYWRGGGSPSPKNQKYKRDKLADAILEELMGYEEFENARLECFVPEGRLLPLLEAIDQWQIRDSGFTLHIFEFGQVYLRSRERQRDSAYDKYVRPRWKKRWEVGRQNSLNLPQCRAELQAQQTADTPHILVLDATSNIVSAFVEQNRQGVPIMLWGRHEQLRTCDAFIDAFATAANSIYAATEQNTLTLDAVRECVHAIREDARFTRQDHALGKHIVLFWDDPYSGLPKNL